MSSRGRGRSNGKGRSKASGRADLALEPEKAKAALGFVPDRPFIYEKLTGAEFLRFVAGLYDQRGDAIEAIAFVSS